MFVCVLNLRQLCEFRVVAMRVTKVLAVDDVRESFDCFQRA